MDKIDFNNKTFVLLDNSENGTADSQTLFKYSQENDLVTANYYGGSIRKGNIIARLMGRQLHMLYQCLTMENELKAGKATADISIDSNNKIQLKLQWQWLDRLNDNGISEYVEI